MNQRRSPCDQSKLTAQVKEHLTLTRHTYVMCSLSLSLSAPILSISTCSNTRVAPHLEVTAEKIRSDNCILSLHIILEPQKVNFSWIFINHRRIQTTCYVPLWCLQLFFLPTTLLWWWQKAKSWKYMFQEYNYVVHYKCKEPLSIWDTLTGTKN